LCHNAIICSMLGVLVTRKDRDKGSVISVEELLGDKTFKVEILNDDKGNSANLDGKDTITR
jgi:translation initiation factor IF-1